MATVPSFKAAWQIVTIPVTITLGNALIKVTVKDELNSFVTDANVSVYSVDGGACSRAVRRMHRVLSMGVSTGSRSM